MNMLSKSLPLRIVVREVLESRYEPGERPIMWAQRKPGFEKVMTETGEKITLASNGGQSSPAEGWILLLTARMANDDSIVKDNSESFNSKKIDGSSYLWTLYGISSKSQNRDSALESNQAVSEK